jgi:predicted metalloprotease with PDZ domain
MRQRHAVSSWAVLLALGAWLAVLPAARADQPRDKAKPEAKSDKTPEKTTTKADLEKRIKEAQVKIQKAQADMDRARAEMARAMEAYRREMKRLAEEAAKSAQPPFPEGFPFRGRFGPRDGVRLGILPLPPGPTLAAQLGLPEGKGIVVGKVLPDTPAAKAGFKTHDVLVELNGKAVPSNPEELRRMLADIKSDTAVDAVVIRKGKRETIKGLKLSENKGERRLPPERTRPPRTKSDNPPSQSRLLLPAEPARPRRLALQGDRG